MNQKGKYAKHLNEISIVLLFRNIKSLFQHLRESLDFTILFIDEIDGLCKKRNDLEQEHSRR